MTNVQLQNKDKKLQKQTVNHNQKLQHLKTKLQTDNKKIGKVFAISSLLLLSSFTIGMQNASASHMSAPIGVTIVTNPGNTVTISWNLLDSTIIGNDPQDKYQLEWSTSPSFANPVTGAVNCNPTSTPTCPNSFTTPSLTDGTYYFRVRGFDQDGQPGDKQGPWSSSSSPSSITLQSVIIQEVTPLVVVAPSNITVNTDVNQCSANSVNFGIPTISGGTPTYTSTNDAPSSFPLGITTITWTVTDSASQTTTVTQQVTVVDNQNPTITAPAAITVIIGSTPSAIGSATASDNCPGVTVTNNAPSSFPLGITTVTWTATDSSGNQATATQIVTAQYNFIGLFKPIADKEFKQGSTIPVKFQLTDANNNYISTSIATLLVDGNPAVSSGSSNTGNNFRYDTVDNQYIFNLSTKGLTIGNHVLRVVLDDGTVHDFTIKLK